jgi:hypothetical protein
MVRQVLYEEFIGCKLPKPQHYVETAIARSKDPSLAKITLTGDEVSSIKDAMKQHGYSGFWTESEKNWKNVFKSNVTAVTVDLLMQINHTLRSSQKISEHIFSSNQANFERMKARVI